MPRGRGGSRQGTPGKGYANRTDLQMKPDMAQNTAATGGMEAPPAPMMMSQTPDDTPNLTDPTQFPDQPITNGLSVGPGDGPNRDRRMDETKALRRYLPLLELYINEPDTPDSVRTLFRYIRGA